jgi:septum formation protein
VTQLILASGSPRRREILEILGLEFDVRSPDLEEIVHPGEAPADAVRRLAEEKASSLDIQDEDLILAADTVVVLDGEILGKPADSAAAVDMLMRLTGRSHDVLTGIALRRPEGIESAVARTDVTFRAFDRPECEAYVATGEPLDKAGSYGIQGFGAALVDRIEGDYFNVMGLPVPTFLGLLRAAGYRYAFGRIESTDTRDT